MRTSLLAGVGFLFACGGGGGGGVQRPPASSQACAVYHEARGKLVVFGGQSASGLQSGTWVWDGNAWSRAATTGPAQRTGAAAAYDRQRQRIVLFGGDSG